MSVLDQYLDRHDLTRYRLAKDSGISATTWQSVSDREMDRWTVRQVRALAKVMGTRSDLTLKELEEIDGYRWNIERVQKWLDTTLAKLDDDIYVYKDDDLSAIVAEIPVPAENGSDDFIRLAVNVPDDQPVSMEAIAENIAEVLGDFTHKDDDLYYPTYHDPQESLGLVSVEYVGMVHANAKYLDSLGQRILEGKS